MNRTTCSDAAIVVTADSVGEVRFSGDGVRDGRVATGPSIPGRVPQRRTRQPRRGCWTRPSPSLKSDDHQALTRWSSRNRRCSERQKEQ